MSLELVDQELQSVAGVNARRLSREERAGLVYGYSLTGHALQELLRQNPLCGGKECLDRRAHVIEVAFLDAAPEAGAISDDDGEAIQGAYSDRPVLVHASEHGQDECIALERAAMQVERHRQVGTGRLATADRER
jgi:hypothetical protein